MLMKAIFAFLIGGFICLVCQLLIDKTRLTPAKILVSLVVFGVLLGALGLYEPLFNLAGTGASLPLLGFGASVAKGVREAIDEEGIIGILKGSFTAMSAGATLALTLGFLTSLFFRGKSKKL